LHRIAIHSSQTEQLWQLPLLLDDHVIQARRQAADQVDRVDDFGLLLLGDLAETKMPRWPIR
jgi:hypothetical protein